MPNKQQPDQPDSGELLEKLSRADSKNLSGAVKKVDGLTEEEQAASKRAQDDKLSKNWQVILQCLQWAFGAAIAALILVSAASLSWLLFTHVQTIIESPEKVAAALSFLFQTLLIVLATAFIDRLFAKQRSQQALNRRNKLQSLEQANTMFRCLNFDLSTALTMILFPTEYRA